ncbi:MAG: hypothetical protein OEX12_04200 [Gammaproteobacteria bacterium]|nr:hypothetical protein [Gammaproteobacteria bacterium]
MKKYLLRYGFGKEYERNRQRSEGDAHYRPESIIGLALASDIVADESA